MKLPASVLDLIMMAIAKDAFNTIDDMFDIENALR